MPLAGGEVHHTPAGQQVEAPAVDLVLLDEREDLALAAAGELAQVRQIDLDVEVSGIGQNGAVLHSLHVLASQDGA